MARLDRGSGLSGLSSDYSSKKCPGGPHMKTTIRRVRQSVAPILGSLEQREILGAEADVCLKGGCRHYTDMSRVPNWRLA